MERIKQYQILQLLDFLNSFSAYTTWHSESQNPFINNLKRQLELYPETKFSIEEMAQNAFISKYHFIRSFKAEVRLTLHQFQLQNRIRKAQRLMHNTKTITEVALTTGFCDQSHYTKQFENCNDFVRHSDRENGNYALLLVNMMANLLIRGYPHKMDAELSICLFGCDNMFYSCLLISYQ